VNDLDKSIVPRPTPEIDDALGVPSYWRRPLQPDPPALHAVFNCAVSCSNCHGPVTWYSGGFGASWWDAEYGRCENRCGIEGSRGRNVVSAPSVPDVIRAAFEAGIQEGKKHA